ncbi:MAG: histidine kinase [Flavobacteriales bacterium]|nr:histidine kinase [Flavobacteriales bacterium]
MKKWKIVLIHIGFWLLYAFANFQYWITGSMLRGDLPLQTEQFWNVFLNKLIPAFIVFYLFYFPLFSFYVRTKKSKASIFIGVGILIVAAFLHSLFSLNSFTISIESENQLQISSLILIGISLFQTFSLFSIAAIGFLLRAMFSWFRDQKIKEQLKQKNHEIELALVKAQLDPHFMFNTLNNIDVLIQMEPSKASSYLNKLSDIMRFMLFETKSEKIPLAKEIEYIKKYIELQKIRSSNPKFIHLKIIGEVSDILISPMIFIPFIENAFKHVEDKMVNKAIQIQLSIQEKQITFSCKNNFGKGIDMNNDNNGLGNELIQKRLHLLYPKTHDLKIIKEDKSYIVNLTLQRNED